MNTGKRMTERRKQLGVSPDKVAEALGVSRSTVYRYESGEIEKLPLDALEPLAEVLQTSPAYLAGWTDNPLPWKNDDGGDQPKEESETIHTIAAHAVGKLSEEDAEKILKFAEYLLSEEDK